TSLLTNLRYDVLRLNPFFKDFLVTADVLEIYMQEFWATATVHHHSIRFKMDNKKHIINLESFIEMLHICRRLPHQPFVEQPFEEEILAFLRFLRHSGAIRRLTDVNINKLHQPWRLFAAITNKCLTGKSSGYDSLWLSQAQILWGLYQKRNVDFVSLMWEDFVYQSDTQVFTMKLEILLESTSNKLMVGNLKMDVKFWATATIKKVNDVVQLHALIDGKKVVVSKAIIRRDLHLDDADGVECLPNNEIFECLGAKRTTWNEFSCSMASAVICLATGRKFIFCKYIIDSMVRNVDSLSKFLMYPRFLQVVMDNQCLGAKRTTWNEFSCSMASAVICLATGRKFIFCKYIIDSMVRNVDSLSKFLMYPRFLQVVMDNQVDDITTQNTRYASTALTQKVFANMRRVRKGIPGVETPLFASMLVQPQPLAKEEVEIPISLAPPSTTTKEESKEAIKEKEVKVFRIKKAKNGRKIEAIDADKDINLVDVEPNEEVVAIDAES
nr:hypothetical protein [Tanacetum cinerariifolium]